MKKRARQISYLPLLITGIAIALFSTVGVAYVMGWSPRSTADAPGVFVLDQTAAAPRCPECGFVVSMREIEEHREDAAHGEAAVAMPRQYEIVVRMADGSNRVIHEATPAGWRTGERVVVIAGTEPSQP